MKVQLPAVLVAFFAPFKFPLLIMAAAGPFAWVVSPDGTHAFLAGLAIVVVLVALRFFVLDLKADISKDHEAEGLALGKWREEVRSYLKEGAAYMGGVARVYRPVSRDLEWAKREILALQAVAHSHAPDGSVQPARPAPRQPFADEEP